MTDTQHPPGDVADPPSPGGRGRVDLNDRTSHFERTRLPRGCHEECIRNLAAAVIGRAWKDEEEERKYYPEEGNATKFLLKQSHWHDVLGWEVEVMAEKRVS